MMFRKGKLMFSVQDLAKSSDLKMRQFNKEGLDGLTTDGISTVT